MTHSDHRKKRQEVQVMNPGLSSSERSGEEKAAKKTGKKCWLLGKEKCLNSMMFREPREGCNSRIKQG